MCSALPTQAQRLVRRLGCASVAEDFLLQAWQELLAMPIVPCMQASNAEKRRMLHTQPAASKQSGVRRTP